MTGLIRNLTKIRIHGRPYYYFDAPNRRDDWGPLAYAHGRKWRVVEAIDNGDYTTYKCEPVTDKVTMLCGVRFVTPKDGGDPILH